ncbi:MAG: hypothetical protein MN733_18170 [Nitrososphaera sp.]|nr:hypothetical protein [Nitrososphaera sp.]
MLTFKTLVKAGMAKGMTRSQLAQATGFQADQAELRKKVMDNDEGIERYVQLNQHLTLHQAVKQLSECLGVVLEQKP